MNEETRTEALQQGLEGDLCAEAADADGGRVEHKPKRGFEIDIFKGWCKACGICAAFCPRKCILLDEDGSPVAENPSRCTGCGWCVIHCPDFAISVRPLKNHADSEKTA